MVEPSPTRKEQNQERTHQANRSEGQMSHVEINRDLETDSTATDMVQLAQNITASKQARKIHT